MIRKQVEQGEVGQWITSVEEQMKEQACQRAWEMGDKEVMAGGKTLNCRDAKRFKAWNHFLGDWHWGVCCHQDGLGIIAFWEFATVGFGGIFTGEKHSLGEFVPVVTFDGLNVAVVVVRGVTVLVILLFVTSAISYWESALSLVLSGVRHWVVVQ
jgi:hypothetical protein